MKQTEINRPQLEWKVIREKEFSIQEVLDYFSVVDPRTSERIGYENLDNLIQADRIKVIQIAIKNKYNYHQKLSKGDSGWLELCDSIYFHHALRVMYN
jgi:hypothetical protein